MNQQALVSTLSGINAWWSGLPVPKRIKKAENKRKIFFDIAQNCLKNENIISISGPRQVGKTTLMGQLIEYQISNGTPPKRILYIPLDNELLKINSENLLIDSLKVYLDFVLSESLDSLSEKVYVYLDEIQSLDKWENQLKTYHDSYEKIKFVVTGSSHTKIYADAAESLIGRINFRVMLPLKFREFMEFYIPTRSKSLEESNNTLRNMLRKSFEQKSPQFLYDHIVRLTVSLSKELPLIKKLVDEYLIKGGYPGLLEFQDDYDRALERLKTDLELTVFKDIFQTFNTRNSTELMALLTLLAYSSGQKVNNSRLSDALGIDRRVIANYISYAVFVYLIKESPFYKKSEYKKVEKMRKIYSVDTGQRNALVGKMNKDLLTESEIGLVMQTAVFNHASHLKFWLTHHTEFEVCYWEDQDTEVDIVLDLQSHVLPIEVKTGFGKKGIKGIKKFLEENKKTTWGIIVTRDELLIQDNILILPLWAFLLMC